MNKSDLDFQRKVIKYYQLTIYMRWLVVILLWFTLGVYGVWGIRQEIQLWLDHFTWSAVYYGLAFNFIPTICLGVCIGMTVSVLVWQSRCIIWGLSNKEKYYLEKRVTTILESDSSNFVKKWLD